MLVIVEKGRAFGGRVEGAAFELADGLANVAIFRGDVRAATPDEWNAYHLAMIGAGERAKGDKDKPSARAGAE